MNDSHRYPLSTLPSALDAARRLFRRSTLFGARYRDLIPGLQCAECNSSAGMPAACMASPHGEQRRARIFMKGVCGR